MTMSWHMMIDFEPPIVGCVISNRNYTFDILNATKECVINIPNSGVGKKGSGLRETPLNERSNRRPFRASRHRSLRCAM